MGYRRGHLFQFHEDCLTRGRARNGERVGRFVVLVIQLIELSLLRVYNAFLSCFLLARYCSFLRCTNIFLT